VLSVQLEADLAQAVSAFLPLVNAAADPALLHAPAFALKHYTHQKPKDAAALHLYALICERLGLVDEASASLEHAANLLEEEFEASESTEIEEAYCIALSNLGRVRLSAGQYALALDAYTNVWGLVGSLEGSEGLTGRLKIQSRLGQALAYSWLEDVDKSLEGFQAALDIASSEAIKSDVAVLLARTLWGLGGEEARETAKNHLLEWSV
jgi:superkiller protein 3